MYTCAEHTSRRAAHFGTFCMPRPSINMPMCTGVCGLCKLIAVRTLFVPRRLDLHMS